MPFIRNLSLIDMIARSFKNEFQTKTRDAILHFRTVGATNIDNEMKQYASKYFSLMLGVSEISKAFFETKIKPRLVRKYGYSISHREFESHAHKQALFHSLQYHVTNFYLVRSTIR